MPKTYTRLTEDERYQIYEGVTDKLSHRKIASLINRHHSVVSREIKRNTGLRGYRPNQANEKAKQRVSHWRLKSAYLEQPLISFYSMSFTIH